MVNRIFTLFFVCSICSIAWSQGQLRRGSRHARSGAAATSNRRPAPELIAEKLLVSFSGAAGDSEVAAAPETGVPAAAPGWPCDQAMEQMSRQE